MGEWDGLTPPDPNAPPKSSRPGFDAAFDSDGLYKGAAKNGFVAYAETLNGRLAMLGFVICFLQEALFGQGVLSLYHLPYDPGAVIMR